METKLSSKEILSIPEFKMLRNDNQYGTSVYYKNTCNFDFFKYNRDAIELTCLINKKMIVIASIFKGIGY